MFALSYKLSNNGRMQMAKRKSREHLILGNDIAVDPLQKGFMRSHPLPSRGGAGVGSVMSVMFFAATPSLPLLRCHSFAATSLQPTLR
jgi:hypothetical protein